MRKFILASQLLWTNQVVPLKFSKLVSMQISEDSQMSDTPNIKSIE